MRFDVKFEMLSLIGVKLCDTNLNDSFFVIIELL